jgi:long-chain acyl-CoA synthetase
MLSDNLSHLSQHPGVRERVDRIVQTVNRGLPSYAQIKRFAVLPEELTEASGELTPTQKVKRQKVAAKYTAELAALYDGSVSLFTTAATKRH